VIAINMRMCNRTRLESFLWHLKKVLERAIEGEYKANEALETAQSLESTMIEQEFYQVASGAASTLPQEIFQTLEAATQRHADRLAEMEIRNQN
jgi:hypothetical protein